MKRWLGRTDFREILAWGALWLGLLLLLGLLALTWPRMHRIVLLGSFSIVFAYLVAPLVEFIRQRGSLGSRRFPRWAAILVVYVLVVAVGLASRQLLTTRYDRQLSNVIGEARIALRVTLTRLQEIDPLEIGLPVSPQSRERIAAATTHLSSAFQSHADQTLDELADHLTYSRWLWLVPLIAFLLLNEWVAFRRSATHVLEKSHLQWRGREFLEQLNATLAGFTRVQLLSCLIIGTSCAVGFALLGLPSAFALGVLAGVMEFLPVVGPLTAALVAASLVTGPRLVVLLAFLLALRLVQDYVIYPRLIGRRLHLHPLAVIAAVLVGARYGGLVGVFCAVPAVGVLSVTIRQYREYRDIERLVREHERQAARAEAAPAASAAAPGVAATSPAGVTDAGDAAPAAPVDGPADGPGTAPAERA
jgi:predicted PurR-regulated permease PerM